MWRKLTVDDARVKTAPEVQGANSVAQNLTQGQTSTYDQKNNSVPKLYKKYQIRTCKKIALQIHREIKRTPGNKLKSVEFAAQIYEKLLNLHEINQRTTERKKRFPFSKNLVNLLVEYVQLEHNVLHCPANYNLWYKEKVEERVMKLLRMMFREYDKTSITPTECQHPNSLFILKVLEKVSDEHKAFDDMLVGILMTKLMKHLGLQRELKKIVSGEASIDIFKPNSLKILSSFSVDELPDEYDSDDDQFVSTRQLQKFKFDDFQLSSVPPSPTNIQNTSKQNVSNQTSERIGKNVSKIDENQAVKTTASLKDTKKKVPCQPNQRVDLNRPSSVFSSPSSSKSTFKQCDISNALAVFDLADSDDDIVFIDYVLPMSSSKCDMKKTDNSKSDLNLCAKGNLQKKSSDKVDAIQSTKRKNSDCKINSLSKDNKVSNPKGVLCKNIKTCVRNLPSTSRAETSFVGNADAKNEESVSTQKTVLKLDNDIIEISDDEIDDSTVIEGEVLTRFINDIQKENTPSFMENEVNSLMNEAQPQIAEDKASAVREENKQKNRRKPITTDNQVNEISSSEIPDNDKCESDSQISSSNLHYPSPMHNLEISSTTTSTYPTQEPEQGTFVNGEKDTMRGNSHLRADSVERNDIIEFDFLNNGIVTIDPLPKQESPLWSDDDESDQGLPSWLADLYSDNSSGNSQTGIGDTTSFDKNYFTGNGRSAILRNNVNVEPTLDSFQIQNSKKITSKKYKLEKTINDHTNSKIDSRFDGLSNKSLVQNNRPEERFAIIQNQTLSEDASLFETSAHFCARETLAKHSNSTQEFAFTQKSNKSLQNFELRKNNETAEIRHSVISNEILFTSSEEQPDEIYTNRRLGNTTHKIRESESEKEIGEYIFKNSVDACKDTELRRKLTADKFEKPACEEMREKAKMLNNADPKSCIERSVGVIEQDVHQTTANEEETPVSVRNSEMIETINCNEITTVSTEKLSEKIVTNVPTDQISGIREGSLDDNTKKFYKGVVGKSLSAISLIMEAYADDEIASVAEMPSTVAESTFHAKTIEEYIDSSSMSANSEAVSQDHTLSVDIFSKSVPEIQSSAVTSDITTEELTADNLEKVSYPEVGNEAIAEADNKCNEIGKDEQSETSIEIVEEAVTSEEEKNEMQISFVNNILEGSVSTIKLYAQEPNEDDKISNKMGLEVPENVLEDFTDELIERNKPTSDLETYMNDTPENEPALEKSEKELGHCREVQDRTVNNAESNLAEKLNAQIDKFIPNEEEFHNTFVEIGYITHESIQNIETPQDMQETEPAAGNVTATDFEKIPEMGAKQVHAIAIEDVEEMPVVNVEETVEVEFETIYEKNEEIPNIEVSEVDIEEMPIKEVEEIYGIDFTGMAEIEIETMTTNEDEEMNTQKIEKIHETEVTEMLQTEVEGKFEIEIKETSEREGEEISEIEVAQRPTENFENTVTMEVKEMSEIEGVGIPEVEVEEMRHVEVVKVHQMQSQAMTVEVEGMCAEKVVEKGSDVEITKIHDKEVEILGEISITKSQALENPAIEVEKIPTINNEVNDQLIDNVDRCTGELAKPLNFSVNEEEFGEGQKILFVRETREDSPQAAEEVEISIQDMSVDKVLEYTEEPENEVTIPLLEIPEKSIAETIIVEKELMELVEECTWEEQNEAKSSQEKQENEEAVHRMEEPKEVVAEITLGAEEIEKGVTITGSEIRVSSVRAEQEALDNQPQKPNEVVDRKVADKMAQLTTYSQHSDDPVVSKGNDTESIREELENTPEILHSDQDNQMQLAISPKISKQHKKEAEFCTEVTDLVSEEHLHNNNPDNVNVSATKDLRSPTEDLALSITANTNISQVSFSCSDGKYNSARSTNVTKIKEECCECAETLNMVKDTTNIENDVSRTLKDAATNLEDMSGIHYDLPCIVKKVSHTNDMPSTTKKNTGTKSFLEDKKGSLTSAQCRADDKIYQTNNPLAIIVGSKYQNLKLKEYDMSEGKPNTLEDITRLAKDVQSTPSDNSSAPEDTSGSVENAPRTLEDIPYVPKDISSTPTNNTMNKNCLEGGQVQTLANKPNTLCDGIAHSNQIAVTISYEYENLKKEEKYHVSLTNSVNFAESPEDNLRVLANTVVERGYMPIENKLIRSRVRLVNKQSVIEKRKKKEVESRTKYPRAAKHCIDYTNNIEKRIKNYTKEEILVKSEKPKIKCQPNNFKVNVSKQSPIRVYDTTLEVNVTNSEDSCDSFKDSLVIAEDTKQDLGLGSVWCEKLPSNEINCVTTETSEQISEENSVTISIPEYSAQDDDPYIFHDDLDIDSICEVISAPKKKAGYSGKGHKVNKAFSKMAGYKCKNKKEKESGNKRKTNRGKIVQNHVRNICIRNLDHVNKTEKADCSDKEKDNLIRATKISAIKKKKLSFEEAISGQSDMLNQESLNNIALKIANRRKSAREMKQVTDSSATDKKARHLPLNSRCRRKISETVLNTSKNVIIEKVDPAEFPIVNPHTFVNKQKSENSSQGTGRDNTVPPEKKEDKLEIKIPYSTKDKNSYRKPIRNRRKSEKMINNRFDNNMSVGHAIQKFSSGEEAKVPHDVDQVEVINKCCKGQMRESSLDNTQNLGTGALCNKESEISVKEHIYDVNNSEKGPERSQSKNKNVSMDIQCVEGNEHLDIVKSPAVEKSEITEKMQTEESVVKDRHFKTKNSIYLAQEAHCIIEERTPILKEMSSTDDATTGEEKRKEKEECKAKLYTLEDLTDSNTASEKIEECTVNEHRDVRAGNIGTVNEGTTDPLLEVEVTTSLISSNTSKLASHNPKAGTVRDKITQKTKQSVKKVKDNIVCNENEESNASPTSNFIEPEITRSVHVNEVEIKSRTRKQKQSGNNRKGNREKMAQNHVFNVGVRNLVGVGNTGKGDYSDKITENSIINTKISSTKKKKLSFEEAISGKSNTLHHENVGEIPLKITDRRKSDKEVKQIKFSPTIDKKVPNPSRDSRCARKESETVHNTIKDDSVEKINAAEILEMKKIKFVANRQKPENSTQGIDLDSSASTKRNENKLAITVSYPRRSKNSLRKPIRSRRMSAKMLENVSGNTISVKKITSEEEIKGAHHADQVEEINKSRVVQMWDSSPDNVQKLETEAQSTKKSEILAKEEHVGDVTSNVKTSGTVSANSEPKNGDFSKIIDYVERKEDFDIVKTSDMEESKPNEKIPTEECLVMEKHCKINNSTCLGKEAHNVVKEYAPILKEIGTAGDEIPYSKRNTNSPRKPVHNRRKSERISETVSGINVSVENVTQHFSVEEQTKVSHDVNQVEKLNKCCKDQLRENSLDNLQKVETQSKKESKMLLKEHMICNPSMSELNEKLNLRTKKLKKTNVTSRTRKQSEDVFSTKKDISGECVNASSFSTMDVNTLVVNKQNMENSTTNVDINKTSLEIKEDKVGVKMSAPRRKKMSPRRAIHKRRKSDNVMEVVINDNISVENVIRCISNETEIKETHNTDEIEGINRSCKALMWERSLDNVRQTEAEVETNKNSEVGKEHVHCDIKLSKPDEELTLPGIQNKSKVISKRRKPKINLEHIVSDIKEHILAKTKDIFTETGMVSDLVNDVTCLPNDVNIQLGLQSKPENKPTELETNIIENILLDNIQHTHSKTFDISDISKDVPAIPKDVLITPKDVRSTPQDTPQNIQNHEKDKVIGLLVGLNENIVKKTEYVLEETKVIGGVPEDVLVTSKEILQDEQEHQVAESICAAEVGISSKIGEFNMETENASSNIRNLVFKPFKVKSPKVVNAANSILECRKSFKESKTGKTKTDRKNIQKFAKHIEDEYENQTAIVTPMTEVSVTEANGKPHQENARSISSFCSEKVEAEYAYLTIGVKDETQTATVTPITEVSVKEANSEPHQGNVSAISSFCSEKAETEYAHLTIDVKDIPLPPSIKKSEVVPLKSDSKIENFSIDMNCIEGNKYLDVKITSIAEEDVVMDEHCNVKDRSPILNDVDSADDKIISAKKKVKKEEFKTILDASEVLFNPNASLKKIEECAENEHSDIQVETIENVNEGNINRVSEVKVMINLVPDNTSELATRGQKDYIFIDKISQKTKRSIKKLKGSLCNQNAEADVLSTSNFIEPESITSVNIHAAEDIQTVNKLGSYKSIRIKQKESEDKIKAKRQKIKADNLDKTEKDAYSGKVTENSKTSPVKKKKFSFEETISEQSEALHLESPNNNPLKNPSGIKSEREVKQVTLLPTTDRKSRRNSRCTRKKLKTVLNMSKDDSLEKVIATEFPAMKVSTFVENEQKVESSSQGTELDNTVPPKRKEDKLEIKVQYSKENKNTPRKPIWNRKKNEKLMEGVPDNNISVENIIQHFSIEDQTKVPHNLDQTEVIDKSCEKEIRENSLDNMQKVETESQSSKNPEVSVKVHTDNVTPRIKNFETKPLSSESKNGHFSMDVDYIEGNEHLEIAKTTIMSESKIIEEVQTEKNVTMGEHLEMKNAIFLEKEAHIVEESLLEEITNNDDEVHEGKAKEKEEYKTELDAAEVLFDRNVSLEKVAEFAVNEHSNIRTENIDLINEVNITRGFEVEVISDILSSNTSKLVIHNPKVDEVINKITEEAKQSIKRVKHMGLNENEEADVLSTSHFIEPEITTSVNTNEIEHAKIVRITEDDAYEIQNEIVTKNNLKLSTNDDNSSSKITEIHVNTKELDITVKEVGKVSEADAQTAFEEKEVKILTTRIPKEMETSMPSNLKVEGDVVSGNKQFDLAEKGFRPDRSIEDVAVIVTKQALIKSNRKFKRLRFGRMKFRKESKQGILKRKSKLRQEKLQFTMSVEKTETELYEVDGKLEKEENGKYIKKDEVITKKVNEENIREEGSREDLIGKDAAIDKNIIKVEGHEEEIIEDKTRDLSFSVEKILQRHNKSKFPQEKFLDLRTERNDYFTTSNCVIETNRNMGKFHLRKELLEKNIPDSSEVSILLQNDIINEVEQSSQSNSSEIANTSKVSAENLQLNNNSGKLLISENILHIKDVPEKKFDGSVRERNQYMNVKGHVKSTESVRDLNFIRKGINNVITSEKNTKREVNNISSKSKPNKVMIKKAEFGENVKAIMSKMKRCEVRLEIIDFNLNREYNMKTNVGREISDNLETNETLNEGINDFERDKKNDEIMETISLPSFPAAVSELTEEKLHASLIDDEKSSNKQYAHEKMTPTAAESVRSDLQLENDLCEDAVTKQNPLEHPINVGLNTKERTKKIVEIVPNEENQNIHVGHKTYQEMQEKVINDDLETFPAETENVGYDTVTSTQNLLCDNQNIDGRTVCENTIAQDKQIPEEVIRVDVEPIYAETENIEHLFTVTSPQNLLCDNQIGNQDGATVCGNTIAQDKQIPEEVIRVDVQPITVETENIEHVTVTSAQDLLCDKQIIDGATVCGNATAQDKQIPEEVIRVDVEPITVETENIELVTVTSAQDLLCDNQIIDGATACGNAITQDKQIPEEVIRVDVEPITVDTENIEQVTVTSAQDLLCDNQIIDGATACGNAIAQDKQIPEEVIRVDVEPITVETENIEHVTVTSAQDLLCDNQIIDGATVCGNATAQDKQIPEEVIRVDVQPITVETENIEHVTVTSNQNLLCDNQIIDGATACGNAITQDKQIPEEVIRVDVEPITVDTENIEQVTVTSAQDLLCDNQIIDGATACGNAITQDKQIPEEVIRVDVEPITVDTENIEQVTVTSAQDLLCDNQIIDGATVCGNATAQDKQIPEEVIRVDVEPIIVETENIEHVTVTSNQNLLCDNQIIDGATVCGNAIAQDKQIPEEVIRVDVEPIIVETENIEHVGVTSAQELLYDNQISDGATACENAIAQDRQIPEEVIRVDVEPITVETENIELVTVTSAQDLLCDNQIIDGATACGNAITQDKQIPEEVIRVDVEPITVDTENIEQVTVTSAQDLLCDNQIIDGATACGNAIAQDKQIPEEVIRIDVEPITVETENIEHVTVTSAQDLLCDNHNINGATVCGNVIAQNKQIPRINNGEVKKDVHLESHKEETQKQEQVTSEETQNDEHSLTAFREIILLSKEKFEQDSQNTVHAINKNDDNVKEVAYNVKKILNLESVANSRQLVEIEIRNSEEIELVEEPKCFYDATFGICGPDQKVEQDVVAFHADSEQLMEGNNDGEKQLQKEVTRQDQLANEVSIEKQVQEAILVPMQENRGIVMDQYILSDESSLVAVVKEITLNVDESRDKLEAVIPCAAGSKNEIENAVLNAKNTEIDINIGCREENVESEEAKKDVEEPITIHSLLDYEEGPIELSLTELVRQKRKAEWEEPVVDLCIDAKRTRNSDHDYSLDSDGIGGPLMGMPENLGIQTSPEMSPKRKVNQKELPSANMFDFAGQSSFMQNTPDEKSIHSLSDSPAESLNGYPLSETEDYNFNNQSINLSLIDSYLNSTRDNEPGTMSVESMHKLLSNPMNDPNNFYQQSFMADLGSLLSDLKQEPDTDDGSSITSLPEKYNLLTGSTNKEVTIDNFRNEECQNNISTGADSTSSVADSDCFVNFPWSGLGLSDMDYVSFNSELNDSTANIKGSFIYQPISSSLTQSISPPHSLNTNSLNTNQSISNSNRSDQISPCLPQKGFEDRNIESPRIINRMEEHSAYSITQNVLSKSTQKFQNLPNGREDRKINTSAKVTVKFNEYDFASTDDIYKSSTFTCPSTPKLNCNDLLVPTMPSKTPQLTKEAAVREERKLMEIEKLQKSNNENLSVSQVVVPGRSNTRTRVSAPVKRSTEKQRDILSQPDFSKDKYDNIKSRQRTPISKYGGTHSEHNKVEKNEDKLNVKSLSSERDTSSKIRKDDEQKVHDDRRCLKATPPQNISQRKENKSQVGNQTMSRGNNTHPHSGSKSERRHLSNTHTESIHSAKLNILTKMENDKQHLSESSMNLKKDERNKKLSHSISTSSNLNVNIYYDSQKQGTNTTQRRYSAQNILIDEEQKKTLHDAIPKSDDTKRSNLGYTASRVSAHSSFPATSTPKRDDMSRRKASYEDKVRNDARVRNEDKIRIEQMPRNGQRPRTDGRLRIEEQGKASISSSRRNKLKGEDQKREVSRKRSRSPLSKDDPLKHKRRPEQLNPEENDAVFNRLCQEGVVNEVLKKRLSTQKQPADPRSKSTPVSQQYTQPSSDNTWTRQNVMYLNHDHKRYHAQSSERSGSRCRDTRPASNYYGNRHTPYPKLPTETRHHSSSGSHNRSQNMNPKQRPEEKHNQNNVKGNKDQPKSDKGNIEWDKFNSFFPEPNVSFGGNVSKGNTS